MANATYKILGQGVPTTTTSTTLYTVGATSAYSGAVISSVHICNTTATAATAYLYVVKGAGTAGTTNAVLYGVPVPANSTITYTNGITLSNTAGTADFIVAGSGTSSALTFTVSGTEII